MEIQETKNPKKYAAVITYTIAVVFLLAGLLIPLTAGKEMLALCYPDVFKALMKGAESEYILAYPVVLFGIGKKVIDISAWISILYLVITAVALIGFIPVGISTKKQTRTASIFAYVVETAAVILLSIWLIILLNTLPEVKFSYNVIIALFGTLLMLVILSCINKRGTGGVKVALLILSAIAFIMLFDWIAMIPKAEKPLDKISSALKIAPLFYGTTETFEGVTVTTSSTGVGYLQALFEAPFMKFSEMLKLADEAKQKALLVLALIAALSVFANYIIDVIGLSTNAKKYGHIFNVARYGIEIAAVLCLMITVATCKLKVGLLLIVIFIAVAIQLAISITRLYRYIVTNRTPEQIADIEARKAARARAREEKQALAIAERETAKAEKERIAAEKAAEKQAAATQPQQPVVVESEPVSQAEAAPQNEATQYPENVQQAEPEPAPAPAPTPAPAPAKEPFVNPYNPPVRRPVEQPVPPPRYTNPYAAPSTPEQYVNPYASPTHQPVRKPYEPQYVNPYRTENFPSYVTPAQPSAYKVNTVYQGPSDEFMRKLNNDEKIEFSMTFIEKSKGDIGKVPDYVIGGDNKKFFSSVFIYLGRVRNLISDGLLNKMYKELNMLK